MIRIWYIFVMLVAVEAIASNSTPADTEDTCQNAVYYVHSLQQTNTCCQNGTMPGQGGAIEDLKTQFTLLQHRLQALENDIKSAGVNKTQGCHETALISGTLHRVSDQQLSASSDYGVTRNTAWDTGPYRSRLNTLEGIKRSGSWHAASLTDQWIQVDFGKTMHVTSIGTQGRNKIAQWVTSYIVRFSEGSNTWLSYTEGGSTKTFTGNWDQDSVHKHPLENPFDARFVKLFVTTWHEYICLRWEIYGCLP